MSSPIPAALEPIRPRPRRPLALPRTGVPGLEQSDVALDLPARLDEEDWESLAPSGIYAGVGRRVLDLGLLAVFCLPALAVGGIVALGNWLVFRRLDRIFFVQTRIGYRGRPFAMVKFRTMREVRATAFASWGGGAEELRVTRFGRFLRNTHLDELPQLLNVLRGDMAFVGPRPEMTEIEEWANEHVPGFTTRLAVRPGITGWAQVTQGYTGHDVEAYREKFRVADWYRRQQSLSVDLEVILRTVVWMLRGRGWRWNDGDPRASVKLPELVPSDD